MPQPAQFPPVVPIRPRRRVEPGLVVAVLLAALVATAIWKPWTGSAALPGLLPRASVAAAAQVSPPASPVPATPASPGPRVVIALQPAGSIPPLDGLDLRAMSLWDPHAAWGGSGRGAATTGIVEPAVRDSGRWPSGAHWSACR